MKELSSSKTQNGRTPDRYGVLQDGKLQTYGASGNPNRHHKDYGIIAKYPGRNNNTILPFSGLWDSAVSESLRSFVVAGKAAALEPLLHDRRGHVPVSFEMLIEVTGVDRLGLASEIVRVSETSR